MLFYIILSIFVIISSTAEHDSILKNRFVSRFLTLSMLFTIILYIPFLNFYISDMSRYIDAFQRMHYMSLKDTLQVFSWDPLFLVMQWTISRFTQEPYIYVLVIFLFYSTVLLLALKKLFRPWQLVYVFFLYTMFPFFFNFIFNASRQGFAIMFLLLAITTFIYTRKKVKPLLLSIISILFHSTSVIFAFASIVASKLKMKHVLGIWIFASLLYLTGLNELVFPTNLIENSTRFDRYTSESVINYYGSTNRLDFYLFSAFFLIISLYLYKKSNLEEKQKVIYLFLVKLYISFNTIFLMLGFIAYSDRLAAYSWLLIPILVSYPIVHKNNTFLLVLLILLFFIFGITNLPFITYGG